MGSLEGHRLSRRDENCDKGDCLGDRSEGTWVDGPRALWSPSDSLHAEPFHRSLRVHRLFEVIHRCYTWWMFTAVAERVNMPGVHGFCCLSVS